VFGLSFILNQAYLQRAASLVSVVVAGHDILPGSLLTSSDLEITQRPVLSLGNDYWQEINPELLQAQWYAGQLGIGKGDIIKPSRLNQESMMTGSALLRMGSEDKRLIAVETDLVRSCSSWLEPGTLVDGLVFIKGKEGYEASPDVVIGPQEDPLLKDLLIVDKKNSTGLSLNQENENGLGRDTLPAVITIMLEYTDEEKAKALIRYNEQGKIYFSPKGLI
jgi:hypothetical protein